MASIREQIMRQVLAVLGGSGKPRGLTVKRNPREVLEDDQLPFMGIFPGTESTRKVHEKRFSPLVERRLNVIIEARVQTVDNDSAADEALDPYLNWITTALQGSDNLGGLVNDINEVGTEWATAEGAEQVFGRAAVTVEFVYQTATANQESRT